MHQDALDAEVRVRAYALLAGESTAEEFEDWFVGATWDDRTDLVASVDHLLAERGVLGVSELQRELRRIVSTVWIGRRADFIASLSNSRVSTEAMSFGGDVTIRRHLAFADS